MPGQGLVIIDDDGRRRESIAKKLRALSISATQELGVHEHDSLSWTGESPMKDACLVLVLVHWRNRGVLGSKLRTLLQESTRLVTYSGGGLRIDEVENDETFSGLAKTCFVSPIWDSVRDGESVRDQVWGKLIQHAIERRPEVPDILRVRTALEFSPALSLLCQGYLAQYALKNRTDGGVNLRGHDDVGRALKGMGWVEDEAAEKVSQIVVDLNLDSEQPMPETAFWTDPFEGSRSLRDGIQRELPKTSLNLPDDIENLVKAIEVKSVSDEQFVSIVSKAYLKLNELLEAV
jgi:hypothetical protein